MPQFKTNGYVSGQNATTLSKKIEESYSSS